MNVLTHHNDTSRTGTYAGETVLNPGTVSSGKFTKLYERPVDGDVYAQVLYVENVHTQQGHRNLFYVASMLPPPPTRSTRSTPTTTYGERRILGLDAVAMGPHCLRYRH